MSTDVPAAPDPGRAGTLDDLVERLRLLKVWAGDPSYEWIKPGQRGLDARPAARPANWPARPPWRTASGPAGGG